MNHDLCIIDPASGGKDRFTFCTAGWRVDAKGEPFVLFENMGAFEAGIVRTLGGREVMRRIIEVGRRASVRMFVSDQRDRLTVEDACRAAQVQFRIFDWTSGENAPGAKAPAVEHVRRWLQERRIALPPHKVLKRELRAFEERISARSGEFTFGVRGNGHDDFVALLITAAMADMALEMRRPDGTGGGGYDGPLPAPVCLPSPTIGEFASGFFGPRQDVGPPDLLPDTGALPDFWALAPIDEIVKVEHQRAERLAAARAQRLAAVQGRATDGGDQAGPRGTR